MASARCKARVLLVASPTQATKAPAMTTRIEHEAALARIEEMRR